MLELTVSPKEFFDEKDQIFRTTNETVLKLEHSLISLSKWESKWQKPFLVEDNKRTGAELLDYIRCMCISNVDEIILQTLNQDEFTIITDYINAPMTATTISYHGRSSRPGNKKGQVVTSELIYYWMITLGIPFECEKWHLNRLLMLIEVCSVKNSGDKKMNKRDIMKQNSAINAARRARSHSKG